MAKLLTKKQERFCLNFVKSPDNATEAAITAGYSKKTARAIASINLTKADIQERIAELRKRAEDATIMSLIERKIRLSEIARSRLTDFMELGQDGSWVNIGKETPNSAAIQEIHSRTEYDDDGSHPTVYTSVKLHDPMKAIDMLNRLDGAYPRESSEGVNINNNIYNVQVTDAKAKLTSIINSISTRAEQAESLKQPDGAGSSLSPVRLELLGEAKPTPASG